MDLTIQAYQIIILKVFYNQFLFNQMNINHHREYNHYSNKTDIIY